MTLFESLKQFPKIDMHIDFFGSIKKETITNLTNNFLNSYVEDTIDFNSLKDYSDYKKIVKESLTSLKNIEIATNDLINSLKENNLMYAEIFLNLDDFKKEFDLTEYKVCELGGNLVLPEYRGRGITTKLQTMEMELAKELGFDYIISMAHPDNIGSCKTLEKIGLNFVKETQLSNGFLRKLYMKKLK